MKYNISLSEKYLLTPKEAAAYFGIGENKIIRIIKENPEKLLIMNGNHQMIKRKNFEKFLDCIDVI